MVHSTKEEKMIYITYVIIDPRDATPVYVGQSNSYEIRKTQHIEVAMGKGPSICGVNIRTYLVDLYNIGYLPKFKIVEKCESEEESLKSETEYIKKLIHNGFPVLNGWKEHKKMCFERFGRSYKNYFIERLSAKNLNDLKVISTKSNPIIFFSIGAKIHKIPISKSKKNIIDKKIRAARKKHPRAYEPYTSEEDSLLCQAYEEIKDISELAELFQRQPSALFSRLKKKGLMKTSEIQK